MHMNQDEELKVIEQFFHDLIWERAGWLLNKPHNKDLVLPKLSMDLLNSKERKYFPAPGMYGGFSYNLVIKDNELTLYSSSWCRVAWGSDQRHRIQKMVVSWLMKDSYD